MVTFSKAEVYSSIKNGTFNELSWVTHTIGDNNFGLAINKQGRLFSWDCESVEQETIGYIWGHGEFTSNKIRKVALLLPDKKVRFTLFLNTEKIECNNLYKLINAI